MSPRRQARSQATGPDAQIAALEAKRVALATQRRELGDVETAQVRVIEEAPERRLAVRVAKARGQSPPETVEQVEAARHGAEAQLVAAREEAAALRTVEQEIGEAIDAVVDAHPEHFRSLAEAKSAATEERRASLAQEAAAVVQMGRDAQRQWGLYRNSCRRRGAPPPREVLISDLGDVSSELAKSQGESYPGGSKQAWERSQAAQAREAAPRLKQNAEAA